MLKFRNAFFYTIAIFMIYVFSISLYLNKGSFSFDEVPTIFNIIFVIIYLIGLLIILLKKHNDTKRDNKLITRLGMKIPLLDNYNSIKDNTKNVYIRCLNINPYRQNFFISDLDGNLLYKIKQKYGYIPATYTIYDPYDNVLGVIKGKIIQLTPCYEISINNKQSFEIKRTMEAMNNNYKFKNIPLDIKGDFWGFNYAIISKENNSLFAEVNTTSIDGWNKLGNADIVIYENNYSLEIICSVACSILGKSKMQRTD